MSSYSNCIVLYATTTGRTKLLSEKIKAVVENNIEHVTCANASELSLNEALNFDLILAGSPTTGEGDIHKNWKSMAEFITEEKYGSHDVSIFAMGDQRHHGKTFGGALWKLHSMWSQAGSNMQGYTEYLSYDNEKSPHLVDGQILPGLIIDHIGQRKYTDKRVSDWVNGLLSYTESQ